MDTLRFDGRVVIVTGGGRGIGRGHARLLAARGARVVVADVGSDVDGGGRWSAPAEAVVREIIDAGGEAIPCTASVADADGAEAIVAAALDAFGRLDALVNNAGTHNMGPFESLTPDDFRGQLDVHF